MIASVNVDNQARPGVIFPTGETTKPGVIFPTGETRAGRSAKEVCAAYHAALIEGRD